MSTVLTLDQYGQPNGWANWQTAVCYKAKDMIMWSLGTIQVVAHGGKSRMTGEMSYVEVPSIIAIRNTHNKKYRTPPLTNSNLFRRDNNICCYCGHTFHESLLTREHIHPESKGGKDTWMNCITSCKPCNNHKADRLLKDTGLELLYIPYVPDRNEMLILKNKMINQEQHEFISSFLPSHSRAKNLIFT